MAVEESAFDIHDVDALYAKRQMSDDRAERLREMAVRLTNNNFGGAVRGSSEIEGSEVDFAIALTAHLWALREGVAASESQEGESLSYQRLAGSPGDGLSETRYGRMAIGFLRGQQSTGIEKARSNWY